MEGLALQQNKKILSIYKLFCFLYPVVNKKEKTIEGITFSKILEEGYQDEQIKSMTLKVEGRQYILKDYMKKNMFTVTMSGESLIQTFYVGSLFEDHEDFFNLDRFREIDKLLDSLNALKYLAKA